MKKIVLIGLFVSVSSLSAQIAVADINTSTHETSSPKESIQKNTSWLGVWIESVPQSLNMHLSSLLKENQGLIIKKVSPDSPAHKSDLQPFDIIIKFNDQEIFSEQQLVNLIRSTRPDTRVKLSIIRQGKIIHQEVITEASPNQNMTIKNSPSYPSPFAPRKDMNRGRMSPPWMDDPIFRQGFNEDYLNRKFDNMQRQMKQFQHHQSNQLHFNQRNGWSQFESVQIESSGQDKHRAEVKYADSDGNKKKFVFEGNMNEIREQIMVQEGMNEDKKHSLLRALDMNNAPPLPFRPNYNFRPDRFNQPVPVPYWFQN